MKTTPILFASLLTLVFCLSACGQNNQASLADLPKLTLDEPLRTIYKQTCANCHENSATGSPQTGNTEQWQIIMNKPMDMTLARVVNGYQGMPPLGQCFECSLEQFEQLVHYMGRAADKAKNSHSDPESQAVTKL